MELDTLQRPHLRLLAIRWRPRAHSGPDVDTKKMPDSLFGAHKVVRGLSRSSVNSVNSVPLSSTNTNSYNNNKQQIPSVTSIFGITPPSDNDSLLSTPPLSSTSISPPPSYTTIYPPSPSTSPLPLSEKPATATTTTSSSLIQQLFPQTSPIHHLSTTTINLDDLVPSFKGAVVVDEMKGTRILYVGGGSYEDLDLRESVCGLLERAEEELGCDGVVLALEKSDADLGGLLHSLMYVGGVISTGPYVANPAYLLVGLDL